MNIIHKSFRHGSNFQIGEFNNIHEDSEVGNDVRIGSFNEFEEVTIGNNTRIGSFNEMIGVQIGENVTIKSKTELRKGTVIGNDSKIDSGVESSGENRIGNRVTLRYNDIIARGVEIYDDIFISPQLMTENLNHRGEEVGGAKIGVGEWDHETEYRVFIGTNVTLAAGIVIVPGVIVGSKANVRKDITEPGVYVGNPARKIR